MTHKINPTTLKPHHDRVLIRRDPRETQTEAGIVIPDDATEKPQTGTVIAVGPGELQSNGTYRPLDVFPGERVVWPLAAGADIEGEDGHTYLLVKEARIMAVIGNEETTP